MAVPYTFANATTSIPLSQLDNNFATAITIGNTAVYLGNTTTSFGNVTLTNATISSLSTPITVAQGGTGLSSTPTAGQIDIGNGTGFTRSTLTAGSNITITNGNGTVTIASTAGGGSNISNGTSNVSIASANGAITMATAGSTAVTVDTSQNVGIGTSSPTAKLDVTGGGIHSSGQAIFDDSIWLDKATLNYLYYTSAIAFSQSGTGERMRIDSSGNLLVGTTSAFASSAKVQNLSAYATRSSGATAGKYWTFGGDGSNSFTVFNQGPTGVYVADGATSWSAFSDERLKTDLIPITNAVTKVTSLRAVTGRLKTDEIGKSRSFLIAQDVQKVLPEAVHVGDDEQGTLGLAYTEVIPLLVAAIQELSAKVTALEAKVGA